MQTRILAAAPYDAFVGAISASFDGRPVLEEAAGPADAGTGAPCTLATCFRACSVGKQFVAACAMLLVEAGELALHAPIGRYLPQCPAAWHELTTHQLLTHTAGLGHWREVPGFDPMRPDPPEEIIARRATRPLLAKPGTQFAYSGVGYLLASNVVERIAAQTYGAFTDERIFAPLGMRATRVGVEAPGPAARGHLGGRPLEGAGTAAIPGTGSLWTTVGDLDRYAHAFARDELLGVRSRELMCTAHVPVGAGFGSFGRTAGYGYGYLVGEIDGHAVHYHTGDIPGYRSMYVGVPEAGAAIVVLGNRDEDDAVSLATHVWTSILAPRLRLPLPGSAPAPVPAPVPASASAPGGRWELWRQDDNGNRFLVAAYPDEAAARARLARFEAGVVHKQTYWVIGV